MDELVISAASAPAPREADVDDAIVYMNELYTTDDPIDRSELELVEQGLADPSALPFDTSYLDEHAEDRAEAQHIQQAFESGAVAPVIVIETDDGAQLADGFGRASYAHVHGVQVPYAKYRRRPRVVAQQRTAGDEAVRSRVEWRGLPISIEFEGGDSRRPNGPHTVFYPSTWGGYGFFEGYEGADGDSLDVILGPRWRDAQTVYLAAQTHDGETFEQFKVMIGFPSLPAAEGAFRLLWPADWLASITELPADVFLDSVLPRITGSGAKGADTGGGTQKAASAALEVPTLSALVRRAAPPKASGFWGKAGAGILYVCPEDGTMLLTLRSGHVNEPGTWGVPGGAVDPDDHEGANTDGGGPSPTTIGAEREVAEELGGGPQSWTAAGGTVFRQGDFTYTTLIRAVTLEEKARWTPTIRLNWENDDAQWFPIDRPPPGLHFGAQYVLEHLSADAPAGGGPAKPKRAPKRAPKGAIWYHGGPRAKTDFSGLDLDRNRGSQDLNAEGPGVYLTSSRAEAAQYGIVHEVELDKSFRPLPGWSGPPKRAPVEGMIRALVATDPDRAYSMAANYGDEGPAGLRVALSAILQYSATLGDAMMSVYHDLYQYDAQAYAQAFVSLGYDGFTVPKNGNTHLVALNPSKLHVRAVDQSAASPEPDEPRTAAKAAKRPSTWDKADGEITGKMLGPLYHGGPTLITRVDPEKLQENDVGYYGEGFYTATDPSLVVSYGPVISWFELPPNARVLTANVEMEKSAEGLIDAVEAMVRRLLEARVAEGAADATGVEADVEDELKLLKKNQIEWMHRVDDYAVERGFDAIAWSPEEVVVKNHQLLLPRGVFEPDVDEDAPKPWEKAAAPDGYIDRRQYEEALRATYADGRSSREHPQTAALPPGDWMVDDFESEDGHEVAQRIEVPVDKLLASEDTYRRDDVLQYALWMLEGREPPPIRVVQTDKGTLKTMDHRRVLAALAIGRTTLPAWVSWATKSPRGSIVGLTRELLEAGAQPLPVTEPAEAFTVAHFGASARTLAWVREQLVEMGRRIATKPSAAPAQEAAPGVLRELVITAERQRVALETAQEEPLEQIIDQLAGNDAALRQQLETAVQELTARGLDDEAIARNLAQVRRRQKLERGLGDVRGATYEGLYADDVAALESKSPIGEYAMSALVRAIRGTLLFGVLDASTDSLVTERAAQGEDEFEEYVARQQSQLPPGEYRAVGGWVKTPVDTPRWQEPSADELTNNDIVLDESFTVEAPDDADAEADETDEELVVTAQAAQDGYGPLQKLLRYLHARPLDLDFAKQFADDWASDRLDDLLEQAGVSRGEFDAAAAAANEGEGRERYDEILHALEDLLTNADKDQVSQALLRYAPADAPSWAFFSPEKRITRQGWFVHFTADARGIKESGFVYGTEDLSALGLTSYQSLESKEGGGYIFAFALGSRHAEAAAQTGKYGEEAVVFYGTGLPAYHHSDEEDQVIVWGPSIPTSAIIPLTPIEAFDEDPRRYSGAGAWAVLAQDGRPLYRGPFADATAWARTNFAQYRRVIGARVEDSGDVVVTLPKSIGFDAWAAEGDMAGSEASGQEYEWTLGGRPPTKCTPGSRVYVAYNGEIIGYAPLIRIEPRERGYALIRGGGAVAVRVPFKVPSFRGFRYRWWPREVEMRADGRRRAAQATHRYYVPLRPPGIGTVPKSWTASESWYSEGKRRDVEGVGPAWGWVEYAAPLSEEDVRAYELVPAMTAGAQDTYAQLRALQQLVVEIFGGPDPALGRAIERRSFDAEALRDYLLDKLDEHQVGPEGAPLREALSKLATRSTRRREAAVGVGAKYPTTRGTFVVTAVDPDRGLARISYEGGEYGPWVPAGALGHLGDLDGRLPEGLHGVQTGDPAVDEVLAGRGTFLGKGNDGVAWRVGDEVVKASTPVPYQPLNEGWLTPEAAAQRTEAAVELQNGLAAEGMPGVLTSRIVRAGSGDAVKAFQVKPYLTIPTSLTKEQLDDVARATHALHERGLVFADSDPFQVGLDARGQLHFFDLGMVQPGKANSSRLWDEFARERDSLRQLYTQHGQAFVPPAGAGLERAWEELLEEGEHLFPPLKGGVERFWASFDAVAPAMVAAGLLTEAEAEKARAAIKEAYAEGEAEWAARRTPPAAGPRTGGVLLVEASAP